MSADKSFEAKGDDETWIGDLHLRLIEAHLLKGSRFPGTGAVDVVICRGESEDAVCVR